MSNPTTTTPKLYALLIGVDHYMPNSLPDGASYGSLGGCVNDITLVEDFLKKTLKVSESHLLKLVAQDTGGSKPAGPPEFWPTYENMVKEFKKLAEMAQSGDQVYIHYSGHGGRATTNYARLKGKDNVDEALVPTDIGNSDARYLRDVEIAHLLKTMVDKGLHVTVVFDSCHSGGATRGAGSARVRGINSIDSTDRPTDSLVASLEELEATWAHQSKGNTRGVKLGSGWLMEPKDYVLLAACRAQELAGELSADNRDYGALTYWFVDSLKHLGLGPNTSYKMLHDRIVAKVHTRYEDQTPQLQGESDWVVFGSEKVQPQYAVNVMQVNTAKTKILLNTGQAQAVRKGAIFAIYPSGHADFSQTDKSLAVVQIIDLGATDSWAEITTSNSVNQIEPGSQAVLLDPGAPLHRNVRLVQRDNLLAKIDQPRALKAVESALREEKSQFAVLAEENESAEFRVTINTQGEYEIADEAENAIKNIQPAIKINDLKGAPRLVKRLVHLTKYRNVQELDNYDVNSPLKGMLEIKLLGKQTDYDPVDKPKPKPFNDPGNTPVLKPGEWTFLLIKNLLPPVEHHPAQNVLNITVLDLQPDFGVTKIYPQRAAAFEPLDPGKEIVLPLRADLPEQYKVGKDVIKVLATIGATDFRVLELPSLDQPPKEGADTRSGGPAIALDLFLDAITADEPAKRNIKVGENPSREWVTAQVEVSVQRT